MWRVGILVSLVVLSCQSSKAQVPHWQHEPALRELRSGQYDDVVFINPQEGWVVSSIGEIWHTPDGGSSWTRQVKNPIYPFGSLAFRESRNSRGLVVGWASTLYTPNTLLWETHDGGEHWVDITHRIGGTRPEGLYGLDSNGDSAWGVGAFFGKPTVVFTHDGGIHWEGKDLETMAGTLVDVHFLDDSTGFAVGGTRRDLDGEAVILRTQNGGQSWSRIYQSSKKDGVFGEWGWQISFPTAQIGYVSVEYGGNESNEPAKVLKTIDGGQSWQEMWLDGVGAPDGIRAIGFIDENTGWVSGRGMSAYTVDGGGSWSELQAFNPDTGLGQLDGRVTSFYMVNDTMSVAVGRRLYSISGYNVGTAIESVAHIPEEMSLSAAYPNPFTLSSQVEYQVRRPTQVAARVVDLLGRTVRTYPVQLEDPGLHRLRWDGKNDSGINQPSGSYLVVLQSDNAIRTALMILFR